MRKQGKMWIAILALLVVLFLVMIVSLMLGPVVISPRDILTSFMAKFGNASPLAENLEVILWQIRGPRILLGALVGLLLALSGVIMQGILRNPLADPYILGVSAGGAIGAAISIIFGLEFIFLSMSSTPILAFICAILAVLVVYRLSHIAGRATPETLILAGVAVSSFSAAILSLIIIISGQLQTIYFWLLGSLAQARTLDVLTVLPYAIIGIVVAFLYSKDLNALLLGEEMAATLGIEVERVKLFLLIIASLMAAASTSVCGLIGFVGLIIPHFVRLIVGPNHKTLVPISLLSGMTLLIFADTLARTLLAPTEIPIGIIMALIGAPFFLYILRKRRLKAR